jgi:hypothetical protein
MVKVLTEYFKEESKTSNQTNNKDTLDQNKPIEDSDGISVEDNFDLEKAVEELRILGEKWSQN